MDGVTVKHDGGANIAVLKLGVEGQINKHANLRENVVQQVGKIQPHSSVILII
nr:autotransporter outer membrane beta-barrel domain-containing protein [Yersinia alsatica]